MDINGKKAIVFGGTSGIGLSATQMLSDKGAHVIALSRNPEKLENVPKNVTTIKMNDDGTPKNQLSASYMAHFPDDNTTELDYPKLRIFRADKLPINVSADKGWVTSSNEVILLKGNVHLYQIEETGEMSLELITDDARVLIDKKYAETDKPATVISKKSTTNSTGIRINMQEHKMEFLNKVHTTIESSHEN